jgi:hypothetical protein
LGWLTEPVRDERLSRRFKELVDLFGRKLLPEPRLLFGAEVTLLAAEVGRQIYVPVIQWFEHPAEDIEQVLLTRRCRNHRTVPIVLLLPVDISDLKERIPFVKRLPQFFEIRFRGPDRFGGFETA